MSYYETVFIVRQDMSPTQVEAMADSYAELLGQYEGSVVKREMWGLRNLAFRMNKNRKGHYGYLDMEAGQDVLDALDYRQRFADDVMRYMTCRVDELTEEPSAVLRKSEDRKRRDRR